MGFAGEVYAFVEDPAHRKAMELAGATSAYTPRHIIAAALAAHASDRISPRLPGLERVRGLERREIRVPAGSPLAGKTLAEARLPVIVVGTWSRSQLGIPCVSDTRIEPSSVLEVVGDGESIERAATLLAGTTLRQAGPFLIAGYGEVGRKVHELLRDVEEDVRVIERREGPGVDVAGDVLDGSVLQKAGLSAARALVLALDSDDATLFATVIARDLARDVPIIARVNHARNLENIHRAGADYALSISGISGEMLSARLLGRSVRARPEHRRVTPIAAGEHAGRTIAELPYSIVIALSRGETTLRVTPATRVEPGDVLWVCASS
jgi:Trk K+ transport system NAD-binding subunit